MLDIVRFMNALASSRLTALFISVAFAFAFALALPSAPASAAEPSAEVTAEALQSRAEAFENEAAFASAAEIWVELMAEDSDLDTWLVMAYRAHLALRTAASSENDKSHLCRAHEVITEVLAKNGLEADVRADFEDFRLEVEADLIVDFNSNFNFNSNSNTDCSSGQVSDLLPVHWQAASEAGPRAPLVGNDDCTLPRPADGKRSALTIAGIVTTDTASDGSTGGADTEATTCDPPRPGCDVPTCDASAPPIEAHAVGSSGPPTADVPRRSPLSIAGTSMLALAAPALGGTVYALIADRAIIREVDELTTYEPAQADRLEDQARRVQALAIGLGVTTAVLTSAGISLIIAGRRRSKKSRELSLLPQAGRDLRGLALIGRF